MSKMKPIIIVSFSGGRSSAYMAYLVIRKYGKTHNVIFVFMNTGMEHENTLKFVHECDIEMGLNLIWIESEVHHGARKSSTHKIVNYNTAHRGNKLFIEMVKKYGLPNVSYLHCTRELKINPFNSYIKSLGIGKYKTAIGIRADEIDRIPGDYKKKNYIYPLADNGITKEMVNSFWDDQPYDLNLEHRLGNCVGCYKKSPKRITENINELPSLLDQIREIEESCGKGGRKMFRKHKSIDDIIKENSSDDTAGSCDDGCELF